MAAVDIFKGFHFTIATDSLGGATIGRVSNYEFTFATNAVPSYQLGSQLPFIVEEGNRSFSGTLTQAFRDFRELLTLVTTSPQAADTHYVRGSTGVTGTQTVDITISGIKYTSWSFSASADGAVVEEVAPFEATGIIVAETTN